MSISTLIWLILSCILVFPGGSVVKNLPATQETWVQSLGWDWTWVQCRGEGHGNPLQYSCLENPHGQRSLAGYSPWGCKESDTTEWLKFKKNFFFSFTWKKRPQNTTFFTEITLSSHLIKTRSLIKLLLLWLGELTVGPKSHCSLEKKKKKTW